MDEPGLSVDELGLPADETRALVHGAVVVETRVCAVTRGGDSVLNSLRGAGGGGRAVAGGRYHLLAYLCAGRAAPARDLPEAEVRATEKA